MEKRMGQHTWGLLCSCFEGAEVQVNVVEGGSIPRPVLPHHIPSEGFPRLLVREPQRQCPMQEY